jgi:hypothetical protein
MPNDITATHDPAVESIAIAGFKGNSLIPRAAAADEETPYV